jgi:cytochrome c biogenesis protein CcdA/glutaredoxin
MAKSNILWRVCAIAILVYIIFFTVTDITTAQNKIYFFYGTGCPHCAVVEKYFEDKQIFENYPIEKKEIYFNRENAVLYNELLDRMNIPAEGRGVPALIMGEKVFMGDRPIIDNFFQEAENFLGSSKDLSEPLIEKEEHQDIGITAAAVIMGSAVDAVNPCEFAVLIILMTAILASGNRKRALRAGLAFSLSIFISYFLMGLGLYQALSIGNVSLWFYTIIGWLAIIIGLLNLKDYFWYGKGILMEVPLSWRPKLKGLINSITNPWGAFAIGFVVSLFLLPCTSGPYIVILGLLAKKTYLAQALWYLFLYNVIFILPMLFITFATYKGFDPSMAEKIRQKRLRLLHLIAGVLMLVMGIAVVLGFV